MALTGPGEGRPLSELPHAEDAFEQVRDRLEPGRTVVFLDFDGTLSPIVDDPAEARPVAGARPAVERLAERCPVAVISGRDLDDVRQRLGVEGVWYAGSHGFDVGGPDGESKVEESAEEALPALDDAEQEVRRRLADIAGATVERKRFSLAVHYRQVDDGRVDDVVDAVEELADRHDRLRATRGRRVVELRPDLDWDKGRALQWLLTRLATGGESERDVVGDGSWVAVYAGDDLTDEDALDVVHDGGVGIVVRSDEHGDRRSRAHVAVDSPEQLVELLRRLGDELAHARA